MIRGGEVGSEGRGGAGRERTRQSLRLVEGEARLRAADRAELVEHALQVVRRLRRARRARDQHQGLHGDGGLMSEDGREVDGDAGVPLEDKLVHVRVERAGRVAKVFQLRLELDDLAAQHARVLLELDAVAAVARLLRRLLADQLLEVRSALVALLAHRDLRALARRARRAAAGDALVVEHALHAPHRPPSERDMLGVRVALVHARRGDAPPLIRPEADRHEGVRLVEVERAVGVAARRADRVCRGHLAVTGTRSHQEGEQRRGMGRAGQAVK
jgi:hypothetical protein